MRILLATVLAALMLTTAPLRASDLADELPDTGLVVMYCDIAVLPSQAMLFARLICHDNALALQGGRAAFQP